MCWRPSAMTWHVPNNQACKAHRKWSYKAYMAWTRLQTQQHRSPGSCSKVQHIERENEKGRWITPKTAWARLSVDDVQSTLQKGQPIKKIQHYTSMYTTDQQSWFAITMSLKEGLYIIQILCRRHPFWSYPTALTIADPQGEQKLNYRRVYAHHTKFYTGPL